MKPCASQLFRISLADRAVEHVRACAPSSGTGTASSAPTVVGQMLFIGAMLTRVIAERADLGLLDRVLLGAERALLLKTLI